MPIVANGKTQQVVPLFTANNGVTSWWSLRLAVEQVAGPSGASVEIKVNGESVPNETGAFVVSVGAVQRRTGAMVVELESGDVVTADVQGPGTVNLSLSGSVEPEGL